MEVIRQADYVIDLGPEGGEEGGEVVFAGTLKEMFSRNPAESHTCFYLEKYLSKVKSHI